MFVLWAAFQAQPADARGLIAPAKKCSNQKGFKHKAKARRSMICLTNYARRKKGLQPYRVSRQLTRSAGRKAKDILVCNQFSHTACGRDFTYWMDVFGYTKRPGWSAGENIAWGNGRFGPSRTIFKAWMKSPGHRRSILSKDYRQIGIGVVTGKFSGTPGARIWVQHFGRRQ